MKSVQTILVTHHGSHMETIRGVAVTSARALLNAGPPTSTTSHPWSTWLNDGYPKLVKRTSETKLKQAHTELGGSIAHNPYTGFTVCALPPMPESENIPGQVSGIERDKPDPTDVLPPGQWIVLHGELGLSTAEASTHAAHVRTLMAMKGLPQGATQPDVLWATAALFRELLFDTRTTLTPCAEEPTKKTPHERVPGLLVKTK